MLIVLLGIIFIISIVICVTISNPDKIWSVFGIVTAVIVGLIFVFVLIYVLFRKSVIKSDKNLFKLPNKKVPVYIGNVYQTNVFKSENYICLSNYNSREAIWFDCSYVTKYEIFIHLSHSDAIEQEESDRQFYSSCLAAGLLGMSLIYIDGSQTSNLNCISQINIRAYEDDEILVDYPIYNGSEKLDENNYNRAISTSGDFYRFENIDEIEVENNRLEEKQKKKKRLKVFAIVGSVIGILALSISLIVPIAWPFRYVYDKSKDAYYVDKCESYAKSLTIPDFHKGKPVIGLTNEFLKNVDFEKLKKLNVSNNFEIIKSNYWFRKGINGDFYRFLNEYENGAYLGTKSNPYFIFAGSCNSKTQTILHKDCKMMISNLGDMNLVFDGSSSDAAQIKGITGKTLRCNDCYYKRGENNEEEFYFLSYSYDNFYHWHSSLDESDNTLEYSMHKWSSIETRIEPSETTDGERYYTCSICDVVLKEILKKEYSYGLSFRQWVLTGLSDCKDLDIRIPETNEFYEITVIGDHSFIRTNIESCSSMGIIKNIKAYAFYGCKELKTVVFPRSLEKIDIGAFGDCTSLNTLKFEGTIDEWKKVSRADDWAKNVPALNVECSDGFVNKTAK